MTPTLTETMTVIDASRTTTDARPRRIYNPIQKDWATYLETASESGGRHTLIEVEVAAGGGNGAHFHRTFDEHFEVLEGTLLVSVDGVERRLGPGDTATAHRGSLHYFRNPTDRSTRFLVTLSPGNEGFEKGLAIAYGLAEDGLMRADGTPRSLYHLALLLEWTETGIPGALGMLQPIFGFIARRARARGIDRELEKRYWQ